MSYRQKLYHLYELDASHTVNASVQFKLDGGVAPKQYARDNASTRSFFIDARGPEGYEAFVDVKIYSSVSQPLIVSLGKRFYDTGNVGHLSITDRMGLPVSTADTPVGVTDPTPPSH